MFRACFDQVNATICDYKLGPKKKALIIIHEYYVNSLVTQWLCGHPPLGLHLITSRLSYLIHMVILLGGLYP